MWKDHDRVRVKFLTCITSLEAHGVFFTRCKTVVGTFLEGRSVDRSMRSNVCRICYPDPDALTDLTIRKISMEHIHISASRIFFSHCAMQLPVLTTVTQQSSHGPHRSNHAKCRSHRETPTSAANELCKVSFSSRNLFFSDIIQMLSTNIDSSLSNARARSVLF